MPPAPCLPGLACRACPLPCAAAPQVRIGGYYRLSDRARGYQLRKVVQTVVNPGFVTGYVNDNSNNDIALLLLDKPSTKPPIGLPKYTGARRWRRVLAGRRRSRPRPEAGPESAPGGAPAR